MKYNPKVVAAFYADEGLPGLCLEYQHIPDRKFRLDLAWPLYRVGIEVQGGIWIKGAHSTGTGIKRDMEKRNLQVLYGWRVLEVEPQDLCTVETAKMVKTLIGL